jgi:hypothetical protein
MVKADRTLAVHTAPENPATKEEAEEASRALHVAHTAMESAMLTTSSLRRSLADAEQKVARYKADAAKVQDGPTLQQANEAVRQAENDAKLAREAYTAAKHAFDTAARTKGAAQAAMAEHQKVKGWVQIRDLVSPDGIPAEMLAKALTRVNGSLRAFAGQTGWHQVAIKDDMSITSDGRPYALCAESRKWRAGLMIAVALAGWSKLGIVVADGADILEPGERGTLLGWLYELADGQGIDTAVVIATLQKAPAAPPGAVVHWLGSNLDTEQAAA